MKPTWKKVGVIGVDAGICWLGDPCYILHKRTKDIPESIGTKWGEFCDRLNNKVTQFKYNAGHDGLGVVVSTGYGDGEYDVEILQGEDGSTVHGVRIMFTSGRE